VVSRLPIGVAVVDLQDNCKQILFNRKMAEFFGINSEKNIGTENFFVEMEHIKSLTHLCLSERSLVQKDITYNTVNEEKTLYMMCYPIFDESGNGKYIAYHAIDRTEEVILEKTLQNSFSQFKAFFEHDSIAIALYEPLHSNETLIGFSFIEINSEYQRLTGRSHENVAGEKATEKEPHFSEWTEIFTSKKPMRFDNWHSKETNKYLSGHIFPYGNSRKYLCVVAMDKTHLVQLRESEQVLLKQIENNLQKLSAANIAMKHSLSEFKTLVEKEEIPFLPEIKDQLDVISVFTDQVEHKFIESEKVQRYLKAHDGIDINTLQDEEKDTNISFS
jgi:PAS domain-containing protein